MSKRSASLVATLLLLSVSPNVYQAYKMYANVKHEHLGFYRGLYSERLSLCTACMIPGLQLTHIGGLDFDIILA